MGHPTTGRTPDELQVINVELSVIRAELPALASEWSKCFVQIFVDSSPNPVRTKPTKKAGQHEWGERFLLPAQAETVLRFELKRKTLLRQQSLASAETRISDLVSQQRSVAQDRDLSILLRPHNGKENENGDQWRLLLRLHEMGIIPEVLEQRQTETVESSMAEIVVKLEAFMTIGDALVELNPYAKIAWKTVSAFYMVIKGQVDRYAKLEDLSNLMKESYVFVESIKSFPEKIPALEGTIRTLLSQTVECTMFLRECSGHGFGEKVAFSAWTDRQINGFMQSFTALKQSLETGTSIQAALVCFRLDENVNKLLNTQTLLKLGPADMIDVTRTECLPNTRMEILAEIFAWISIPTTKDNVYWLHGFPGAGKSTIATSVANIFRDLRRLGAFIFFTRGMATRNDPALLIRTLAYQLGEFDHRIGSAITKVIDEVSSLKQAPLRWQFQKLLVEPLASLKECLKEGPILIVIDALDECGPSAAREELLRVLASQSSQLPPTIRIFITSRAERDIRSTFSNQRHIFVREIDIRSPTNEKDVQTYIHHQMVGIRLQNEWLDLPSDWPGKARTTALALRASGLFVWASTACRYIEKGQDPEERLSQLEHASLYRDAEAALDGMYITALESAGRWDDVAFVTDFQEIVGLIIVAEDPLTARTIDLLNADMEGKSRRPCLHTIRHLGTVLQWEENQPICVIHPSFADFITERRRSGSGAWFIDRPAQHLRIARLCIARLKKMLKKNMCGLRLSMSGWTVQLPEDVVYPARYWVDHLCNSETHGVEEKLAKEIYGLLFSHFLHWIEVMTMMRRARQTIGLVMRLQAWIDVHRVNHEALCTFTKDAVRFCQAYAPVYEQHPLLVYQSALPFAPTATTVFQTFKDHPEIPIVAGGFREQWSPVLTEFGRPGGNVVSISCSSDGQYIASTNLRNIFVWDSTSGELTTRPMQADKFDFTVIAFSPNNQHIASGSTDGRVKLWDALSGRQVGATLEQHSGPVYALAFSNDANMLVSASKDQTVIVWNANDGSMMHTPLTGHQKTILCLAFSPTCSRFASGSRDRSIRIWDAAIGGTALSNIHHSWGAVTSLAYTPDGNRIISGSDDRTIRVWDAYQGMLLHDPVFKGHNSDIYSIAISPNGTLLASASKDTTVRLWNISTGTELSHLVRQHRLPVRCVTFSHDGKRIVTGSNDTTVRVWDVESVGSMGTPRLHKGLVTYVAFSADGTRLVSGGLDKTVRVWCTKTGRALMDPLQLQREVNTVAFDGVRILAADKDGSLFAWDMATREPLTATAMDHPAMYVGEGRLILEGKWIVDKTTNEALSLLPNMSPAKARASHGNKIAIGLANGSIVILHFPQLG